MVRVTGRTRTRIALISDLNALLEKDPAPKVLWQFYGPFAALLASIYGHRGGVFQNITLDEVKAAQRSSAQKAHLTNVTSHKTNQAYGPAQIVLTDEEYGWVQRFVGMKDRLPGGADANVLFFMSTPNPCKNLNNYFQEAWKPMGLPRCLTIMDIRTSIANHAKFTHSSEDRLKIFIFMCHDVKMADKFYVTNLTPHQVVEHRRLFEAALEGEELEKGKRTKAGSSKAGRSPASDTSESDTGVVYQESGTSSPESTGCVHINLCSSRHEDSKVGQKKDHGVYFPYTQKH